jgi:hypothetical protein
MNVKSKYRVFLGSLENVKYVIDDWGSNYNIDIAFVFACSGGNMDVINFLIKRGAGDFSGGFNVACNLGNINVVQLMIDNGVSDWSAGMSTACVHGHRNIVDLILRKGRCNVEILDILIASSFKYRWIDLIVKYGYENYFKWRCMVHRTIFKYKYDILGWNIGGNRVEKIVYVRVKLFDQNLCL